MTYPWPDEGTPLDAISTPMPVIDEDRLAANIARAQSYLDRHGMAFRPHIKTHKIPAIAKQQLQAGAIGINCQKVSEAEVFADAGFDDILITYNILGVAKLSRLRALNARIGQLSVVADSAVTIAGLAGTFDAERPLSVLVECDTGGKRCGVQTPDAVLQLAEKIVAAPGLNFKGILTYPAPGGAEKVENFIRETMALLAEKGIDCPVRSSGGSPDFSLLTSFPPQPNIGRAPMYIMIVRCCAPDIAPLATWQCMFLPPWCRDRQLIALCSIVAPRL